MFVLFVVGSCPFAATAPHLHISISSNLFLLLPVVSRVFVLQPGVGEGDMPSLVLPQVFKIE